MNVSVERDVKSCSLKHSTSLFFFSFSQAVSPHYPEISRLRFFSFCICFNARDRNYSFGFLLDRVE